MIQAWKKLDETGKMLLLVGLPALLLEGVRLADWWL